MKFPYALNYTRHGLVSVTEASEARIVLSGTDNYERPAQEFADQIAALDDKKFTKRASDVIWLSAYAANNPRSDYHWQASAFWFEAQRRGKPGLYEAAWQDASGA